MTSFGDSVFSIAKFAQCLNSRLGHDPRRTLIAGPARRGRVVALAGLRAAPVQAVA